MKGVIIICLLSLSVCYSLPSPAEEKSSAPTKPTTLAPNKTEPTAATIVKADNTSSIPPANSKATTQVAVNTTNPPVVTPGANDIKKDDKTAEKDNKADNKTNETTSNVVPPTSETKDAKDTTTPPVPAPATKQNDTKADTADKKETTTPKSAVEVTTPSAKVVQASRAFDGASFVGGIILTLGLLGVGFLGLKYYKNRTGRNYYPM